MRRSYLVLLLIMACGADRETFAPSVDAGDESDDAGRVTPDGGRRDGGRPVTDAGPYEADAGPIVIDAGVRDAGPLDAGTPDAGTPDAGAAPDGGPARVAFCQIGCTSSSDCAAANAMPPYAASNYACTNGLCEYAGCHSDQECQTGLQDSSQVCRATSGVPTCQKGCASPSTCGYPPAGGAFASDRYACTNHVCEYLGCATDQQCFTTYSSTAYLCRQQAGFVPVCLAACSSASACGSPLPAYDSSHYVCESSTCRYTGCRSDEECALSFSDSRYVCR